MLVVVKVFAETVLMALEKLSLLHTILRKIVLPNEAIEGIIDSAPPVDFLRPPEQSFYQVLKTVIDSRLVIRPRVALADLFFGKIADTRLERLFLNSIFLLCEPKTMRPVAGIELDNWSNDRPERQERDVFLNGLFHVAEVALVRVPAKRRYEAAELNSLLGPILTEVTVLRTPSALRTGGFALT
jgi:hypothetical protein